jgi:ribosome-binding protein aMBF1 (putative translation factor)
MTTDDLDRIVERMRRDDPSFAPHYELQVARAMLVKPIVDARRARGWSQRDLAREAGIQQPVLARLEVGDTDPRASTLLKLARALELELTWTEQPRRSA